MISRLRFAVCVTALLTVVPFSVSATSFLQPKITQRAATSMNIAGKGTVVVQVEVFADGSHKVIRVVNATNPGNIVAALDVARNSSYAPAKRNGKPVTSFYDFTLRFTGKSPVRTARVSHGNGNGSGVGLSLTPDEAQTQQMIKAGNYAGARERIQAALARNPNDTVAHELLGLTYYYQRDFIGAAGVYQQVPILDKAFAIVAAQSFSQGAIDYAMGTDGTTPNLQLAQLYANKAIALSPDSNSYYALGLVQLKNQDTTNGIASLQKARDLAFADPKMDAAGRENFDNALFQGYMQANDLKNAQLVADEIKKLDPSSKLPTSLAGQAYLQQASADVQAHRRDSAFANFDKAVALGDPSITATAYAQESFLEVNQEHPQYYKAKDFADKAIAADPNNAYANWAEGADAVARYTVSHDPDVRKQALTYLTKASQIAQSQGNTDLAAQIDKYSKSNLR